MKRFVKLTKEYRDLEKIVKAQDEYKTLLSHIEEARMILESEEDADLKEMAKEELEQLPIKTTSFRGENKIIIGSCCPQDGKMPL